MAGWRTLRSVLPNFLDTFASRYTECKGYWLFGLAESDLHGLVVNLLTVPPSDLGPFGGQVAVNAARKFREQCGKQGVSLSCLRSATLAIERIACCTRICGSYPRMGCDYLIIIEVQTMYGHRLVREKRIFVAPHDPICERRSAHC